MKKIFICLFALALSTSAYCQEMNKIELTDGSVIKGRVISLDNGTYTIDAQTLGRITIGASKIKKIETENGNAPLTPQTATTLNPGMRDKINNYTAQIMGNPDILKITAGLANDPQFQALMKDPQIMRAIYAGDMQTLMANPKFMNAINNPEIEKIKNKIEQ